MSHLCEDYIDKDSKDEDYCAKCKEEDGQLVMIIIDTMCYYHYRWDVKYCPFCGYTVKDK